MADERPPAPDADAAGGPAGSAAGGPAGSAAEDLGDRINQPPPILGRWSRLYWLVGALLVADMILFWLLTRWAA